MHAMYVLQCCQISEWGTNGLISQYFTKGSSFENITDNEVEVVMNKLNHSPPKNTQQKTPYTVFFAGTLQEAA